MRSHTTLLTYLFPFGFGINTDQEPVITNPGTSLHKAAPAAREGALLLEVFQFTSPKLSTINTATLAKNLDKTVYLQLVNNGSMLRGQLLQLDDGQFMFAGAPQVHASNSLEHLSLGPTDFAPHDLTLDLLQLHRVRELEVQELDKLADKLRTASQDRDRYSLWASTDSLTGLANRRAFWREVSKKLSGEDNQQNKQASIILMLDVDRFKTLNEDYGHHTGDQILINIAREITGHLDAADIPGRLGGDEFGIYLHDHSRASAENLIVEVLKGCQQVRYVDEFANEYTESQQPIVRVSIGARQASGATALDELVTDADFAMREGRASPEEKICWFETGMRNEQDRLRQLTLELREAITHRQIQPVFQPIVDLASGKVVSFEALARWTRADGEFIPPDVFIDLAQKARIVPDLDAAIMERSLFELERWTLHQPDIQLQVNLSLLSLSAALPATVENLLNKHGLRAEQLTIELTESWVLENNEQTTQILEHFNSLGVKVHLDDFGTGFSALSHLLEFPIDGLKIDRSFVALASTSKRARKLIKATIGIARSLDIEVVAEGIETAEQEEILREYGCDMGQGYYYSRPVDSEKVVALLNNQSRAA